ERHATVEYLRVAPDAIAVEIEAADAVEHHARAVGLGALAVEREAVARIADVAYAHGMVELPAEVAAAIGEVREHLLDGFAAGAGPEEVVVVGAVGREEVGQRLAVAGCGRRCEAADKLAELHSVPPDGFGGVQRLTCHACAVGGSLVRRA